MGSEDNVLSHQTSFMMTLVHEIGHVLGLDRMMLASSKIYMVHKFTLLKFLLQPILHQQYLQWNQLQTL